MVYFKEEQRFNQWWLWTLILALDAILFVPILTNYSDRSSFVIASLIVIVPMLLINWLLFTCKLKVEIKNHSIYYQFVPFHLTWRKIKKEQVDHYEVITYNPIKDYGGWGLRLFSKKGRAYNIKGNQGLRIYLKNKPKSQSILFGTQKPDAVTRVMDELMEKEDRHG